MKDTYLLKHHRLEKTHWYLKGRRNLFTRVVGTLGGPEKILEIGCSTGALIVDLNKQGYKNVVGVDINEDAIAIAKSEGVSNVEVVDGEVLPFADGTFDLIIACDVLEHIEDEGRVLLEWGRVLKPGGIFMITVPAFMFLWSGHDVENAHYRRYTARMLRNTLEQNNFTVERVTYWNTFLFIPISIFRLLLRLLPARKIASNDQLYEFPQWVGYPLEKMLMLENYLIARGINFPFGVTAVALATKKSK